MLSLGEAVDESIDEGLGVLPLGELGGQVLAAGGGETVVGTGLAGLRGVGVGGGQARRLQALERGVEGGLLDRVLARRDLGDRLGERVSMF